MRHVIPVPRSTLAVAALALLLGPAASRAQSIDPLKLDPLKLVRAELEIDTYRWYETRGGRTGSFRDGVIGEGDDLTVLVAVRNNGQLWGSFDYVLGSEDRTSRWRKAAGTDLRGGDRHLARFDMPWLELVKLLAPGSGNHKTCIGVWLVERDDPADHPWTDANNPNHQRKVCFALRGPS